MKISGNFQCLDGCQCSDIEKAKLLSFLVRIKFGFDRLHAKSVRDPRHNEEDGICVRVSEPFQMQSRKERNKFNRAMNGNTSELTLISANVTSWKKIFNEIVRLNPNIMALQ